MLCQQSMWLNAGTVSVFWNHWPALLNLLTEQLNIYLIGTKINNGQQDDYESIKFE